MHKRILIVGGVAGGASVAARVRRIDGDAEVIMFDKGPHVSFSNCALPYHLSGMIENSQDLVLMSPEKFKNNTISKPESTAKWSASTGIQKITGRDLNRLQGLRRSV